MKFFHYLFFLLAVFFSPFYTSQASSLTVQQVLDAFPEAATMTPSLSVLHISSEKAYRQIENQGYELRFVRYADPLDKVKDQSLEDLAKAYHFDSQDLKERTVEEGPISIYTFVQPSLLKERGVSVVISVRPLTAQEQELYLLQQEKKTKK